MARRKSLGKKLRFDVFKRDGFACQYCGAVPPQAVLWIDHIVPVCDGGSNDIDNLVTACDACNLGKGRTPLDDVPKSLADKAAETAEREDQIRGYAQVMAIKRQRIDSGARGLAIMFAGHYGESAIPSEWLMSLRQFVGKIGEHEATEAMEIALSKGFSDWRKCFKYFCGICWNKSGRD